MTEAAKPDFDALRAKRNADFAAWRKELEAEGFTLSGHKHDPNACYCDCAGGGPCEHSWDGKPYESDDRRTFSATCSRCGAVAIHHDMRVMP